MMELTIAEVAFKSFFNSLDYVDTGYCAISENPLDRSLTKLDFLTWTDAKLYHCRTSDKSLDTWLLVRQATGEGFNKSSWWYLFDSLDNGTETLTLRMYGYYCASGYIGCISDGYGQDLNDSSVFRGLSIIKELYRANETRRERYLTRPFYQFLHLLNTKARFCKWKLRLKKSPSKNSLKV